MAGHAAGPLHCRGSPCGRIANHLLAPAKSLTPAVLRIADSFIETFSTVLLSAMLQHVRRCVQSQNERHRAQPTRKRVTPTTFRILVSRAQPVAIVRVDGAPLVPGLTTERFSVLCCANQIE